MFVIKNNRYVSVVQVLVKILKALLEIGQCILKYPSTKHTVAQSSKNESSRKGIPKIKVPCNAKTHDGKPCLKGGRFKTEGSNDYYCFHHIFSAENFENLTPW